MDKTRREGLLYHLGKWFYGEYILEEGDGASGPVLPVTGEYCLWYVDEMIDFIVHHGVEEDDDLVEGCQSYVDKISRWYEDDERKYFDFVESKWGKRKLMSRASNLRDKFEDLLSRLSSPSSVCVMSTGVNRGTRFEKEFDACRRSAFRSARKRIRFAQFFRDRRSVREIASRVLPVPVARARRARRFPSLNSSQTR
jgi:hypothetical protein